MGTRFGAEAESYDRVRPRYPAGIYEWIDAHAGGPGRVADVGRAPGSSGPASRHAGGR